ncbi:hypothetical protein [Streptomyces sp. NPDC058157]|uniref:hypothetical protein n=1 Tax=Streptomyces sp. NPDC058157 TaxID=3346360 RepID=UPI0036EEF533
MTVSEYGDFDLLTARTGPDGTRHTFTHDTQLRLTGVTNPQGLTWHYTYDPAGRLASETDFDARTTPSGSTSHWTYDTAGRRTSLTTAGRTLTFERDAAGQELTRTLGPSLSLTHAYDVTGRRTAQSVIGEDGRTLQRRGYSYRADGYLTGIDDSLTGPRTFTLDAAARVTAVDAANWSERYAYDEAGNQTTATWPAHHPGTEAQGARSYTGTRITHAGAIRYEHDALGRRTSKQRLTGSGKVAEETLFTWDGTTLCEESTGRVTLTWTHQGLHPITQTERIDQSEVDDRFFAIATDIIGTPTHLLAEDGTTAWHTRTTLWGTTTWNRTATAYTEKHEAFRRGASETHDRPGYKNLSLPLPKGWRCSNRVHRPRISENGDAAP